MFLKSTSIYVLPRAVQSKAFTWVSNSTQTGTLSVCMAETTSQIRLRVEVVSRKDDEEEESYQKHNYKVDTSFRLQ